MYVYTHTHTHTRKSIYTLCYYCDYSDVVLMLEECKHPMVMKDMCAECGADLRRL